MIRGLVLFMMKVGTIVQIVNSSNFNEIKVKKDGYHQELFL